jgi:glycosyltransferase involved in cell wall biosynthesis
MHDIRSLLYARRAEIATGWAERRRLRAQARRYFEFEKKYASRYDLLIAVSEVDADWIRRHYNPKQVIALPLPIDTEYFTPEPNSSEKPGRIVFTGLMNHPPNMDAAIFFATEVFPKIRAAIPGVEFYVVGKDPSPEVLALGQLPGVVVTGTVLDTRPYLSSAAVVVVPLRFGSGVRHKILEAWAMRKCVVSTSIGAEGLTYTEGEHLAIADSADALADTVIRGLCDSGFRDRLRQGGREIVETFHDPKRIARRYYDHLGRSVAACRERPMRVALDMRWMLPGLAGGLENLARALLDQIVQIDAYNRYTVLLPTRCRYDFDLRDHANFKIVSRDSANVLVEDLSWALRRKLHSLLRLDYWQSPEVRNLRYLRGLDADIVYSFPGYIHPDVYALRHVLQIPDIQHEYYPEFFSNNELTERRRIFGESIPRADHIVAISEFTRKTLIERLAVPPDKITAVPLAAEQIFRPSGNLEADNSVMRKYGLEIGKYLFFPGHTWPHKNHCAAIAALALLRDRYNTRMPLVFTGGDRGARYTINQQIKTAGLDGQVFFLGYCPREEMPALYRGAASLVFPSLFEGFGMPVLEAMASGCPVVCSNTTSLPEIAGDAALMVDPNDHDRLAEAISRITRDRELRASLIQRGFAQSSLFSWRRNALETIAVLYRANQRAKGVSCE